MPVLVPQIIIWTFVASFVLCVGAGLLVIFDLWSPRDPAVRKWLVRGVIVSVVGAVVGFGVRQFATEQETGGNQAEAEAVVAPPAPAPTPAATPSGSPSAMPSPTPSPDPNPSPTPDATIPAAVADWAATALGTRPGFAAIDAHPYPTCVEDLRAMPAESALAEDATACVRALDRYHFNYVLTYYALKQPYGARLDAEEQRLRGAAGSEEGGARYRYVLAEIARLNGPEWDRLQALDQRLRDDRAACARRMCRAAS